MPSPNLPQTDLNQNHKQLLDRLLVNLRNIRYTWGEDSAQFQDADEMMRKVLARVEEKAGDGELEGLMRGVKLSEVDDGLK